MKLEKWGMVAGLYDPRKAPELQTFHLVGEVYGHPDPRFRDGTRIRTAAIVGKQDGFIVSPDNELGPVVLVVTESGRDYELGDPDPGYEMQFPNARNRLLGRLGEVKIPTKEERQ